LRLVIVSNRVAAPKEGQGTVAGGLAVALTSALQKRGGIWFGWSGDVVDDPAEVPRTVRRRGVRYELMDLSQLDRDQFYLGFANRALWPAMHFRLGLTDFSREDYEGYNRVNERFARALASRLRPDDLVWVHDYHLLPFGQRLRELGVNCRIGYFHHIPWPPVEVFGAVPSSTDLLTAMAAYDLIGLQTAADAENLTRSMLDRVEGAGAVPGGVSVGGHTVRIDGFPIGIDANEFADLSKRAAQNAVVRQAIRSFGSRDLIIGVDRLDYTKGIIARIEAYEQYLLEAPERRGQSTLLQIAPPSRIEVPEYAELDRQANEAIGRVNGSQADLHWTPVRFVKKAYSRAVLAGLYRRARVGLVTPLRDGMNLVAKEYVAAQDERDPGVLILSEFAGAARQMKEALIVNPMDKVAMAHAIAEALHMAPRERKRRHEALLDVVRTHDIGWWTQTYLEALAGDDAQAPAAAAG